MCNNLEICSHSALYLRTLQKIKLDPKALIMEYWVKQ